MLLIPQSPQSSQERFEQSFGKFTDVTLVLDDGEFKVYRGILTCSPVFNDMIDNKLKEGHSGIAIIEDLKKEVHNEFLYYIYYGRVKNLKENEPSLMKFARIFCPEI